MKRNFEPKWKKNEAIYYIRNFGPLRLALETQQILSLLPQQLHAEIKC